MRRVGIAFTISLFLGLAAPSILQSQEEAQSSADQLTAAQDVVSRAERLSTRIATMVSQAQRDKDIMRVECLDDKLAQVNANLRTARARLSVLEAQRDPQMRAQAVTVLQVLEQKFQVLDQEASQCIGQNIFETGSTKLQTDIDLNRVPVGESSDPTIIPNLISPDVAIAEETNTTPPIETVSTTSVQP